MPIIQALGLTGPDLISRDSGQGLAEALAGRLRSLAAQVRTPLQFAGLAHHGRGAKVTLEEVLAVALRELLADAG